MSTTISTTTTTSVTVSGAALRDAFATLARVGKTRAATIHDAGDGVIIISVRVTPREESHGSVSVSVPATIEHGDDPLPFVLAAGVLTLPISDGPVTIAATATGFTVDGNPVASGFTVSESHHSLLAPTIPTGSGPVYRSIPAMALVWDVPRVAPAVSKDRTRPVLTGALMQYRDGTLTLATTDSYRLHVATITCDSLAESPDGDYIVPGAFLARVAREAKRRDAGNFVFILHGEGWTVARVGPVTIAAKDITGQYPDHRQLVPSPDLLLDGDTAAWRDALTDIIARGKAAGLDPSLIMEGDGNGTVSLLMKSDRDGMEVRGTVPAMGDAFDRMGVNARSLADCIAAMPGDTFLLGLISPLRPVLMRSGDVTTLLMPIRLPG